MARFAEVASVAEASGRRETLLALRQVLAEAIDDGPADRDLAALSNRLMQVVDELEELGVGVDDHADEADVDDLAARRREKLAAAAS